MKSMFTKTVLKRPDGKTWSTAKLYRIGLWNVRTPICGLRLAWCIVGWKWVRICTPINQTKFKMTRTDWDALPEDDRMETSQ